jgi:hypothetical protein
MLTIAGVGPAIILINNFNRHSLCLLSSLWSNGQIRIGFGF